MTSNFTQQLTHFLSSYGRIEPFKFDTPFLLLSVNKTPVLFHLITLQHGIKNPLFLQNMTLLLHQQGYQVVHLWEDRWLQQQILLQQTINCKLGNCRRIFARQTSLRSINTTTAICFLNQHHILSGVKSRYHFGLFYQEQLVAVASFSKKRILNYTFPHRNSYEWVRYATLSNMIVVGGLSKILQGFIQQQIPDHIMTYGDMDFGMAYGFQKVGFTITQIMQPLPFNVDENLYRTYKISPDCSIYYNAGNVKLELEVKRVKCK